MAIVVSVTLKIDMDDPDDREIVYRTANGQSFRWHGEWFMVTTAKQSRNGVQLIAKPDPSFVENRP